MNKFRKTATGILAVLLAGVGYYVVTPNGDKVILPSPTTIGVINSSVTQANIQQTICTSGYTATIRPSASYTTALKKRQLATVYSYYSDKSLGSYEEDHLISLELGGNPTAEANLWPEPYAGIYGARVKDQVEDKLHRMVCTNQITLAAAQLAISSNWYEAKVRYTK